MKDSLTACRHCKHLKDSGETYPKIWHHLTCLAVERDKVFDPHTATMKWSGEQYEYCRDVNIDGHCPHFDKTPSVLRNTHG